MVFRKQAVCGYVKAGSLPIPGNFLKVLPLRGVVRRPKAWCRSRTDDMSRREAPLGEQKQVRHSAADPR
jgi:hypothetical protein